MRTLINACTHVHRHTPTSAILGAHGKFCFFAFSHQLQALLHRNTNQNCKPSRLKGQRHNRTENRSLSHCRPGLTRTTTTNPNSFRKEWKIHLFAPGFLSSKEQGNRSWTRCPSKGWTSAFPACSETLSFLKKPDRST